MKWHCHIIKVTGSNVTPNVSQTKIAKSDLTFPTTENVLCLTLKVLPQLALRSPIC